MDVAFKIVHLHPRCDVGEPDSCPSPVETAESTDWLNYRGDAFMDLAEVLRLIGRPSEAAEALRAADKCYEQKGNVVSAARARTQLEDMEASTQG